jgi:CDP-diacylglycerol--glycerol-3-phosphate 3-phosphatidyltransferase
MNQDEFFTKWSALHGSAEVKGIVRLWLTVSFVMAKGFSLLKVSPNLLTLIGLLLACAMVLSPLSILAIVLLVLSLMADGIDGSLAILTSKESKWGSALDAVADRISEAIWLYVAYRAGVSLGIAITLWIVASTQEYARARVASLGYSTIDLVTPTERPVRASAVFIILVAAQLELPIIGFVALLLLLAQVVSLLLVMRNAYYALR